MFWRVITTMSFVLLVAMVLVQPTQAQQRAPQEADEQSANGGVTLVADVSMEKEYATYVDGVLTVAFTITNNESDRAQAGVHYRVIVEEDTPPLWIWSNPGDLSKALVDPRLNSSPILGWLGDEAHEELTGCGDNNVDLIQDVIVKDLYPSCDAGKMYYRELSKTLLSGETAKMLKFPPEVYRGFLDIYIENKNTYDLVVSVYIANTSTPYPKDIIAPQVRVKPNDTYERKAQPMIKGETLFISAFNGSTSVLIQTVEETYK